MIFTKINSKTFLIHFEHLLIGELHYNEDNGRWEFTMKIILRLGLKDLIEIVNKIVELEEFR